MRATCKRFFWPIFLSLVLLLCATLTGWCMAKGQTGKDASPMSVLLCGVDAAGNHTDVMALVSVTPGEGRMSLLQIPRDTLLIPAGYDAPVKINSRFAAYVASGRSEKEASVLLKQEIAALLGVHINHVLVTDTDTVASFLDALGGITVNVPREYTYENERGQTLSMAAGSHRLSGREAVGFLRYRAGYALGDLDRMDAQKLFFSAVVREIADKSITLPLILRAGQALSAGHVWTDMPLWSTLKELYGALSEMSAARAEMTTLAGEAMYTDRTWYYVVHRAAADAQLAHVFHGFYGGETSLDPEKRLTDAQNTAVNNAYTDSDRTYRLYTADDGPALQ